jgi:hypothetical protein
MPKTPAQLASSISKVPYWWAYAIGIVLIILSAWLWWTKIYLHPSNVFWAMLDNSLQTRSVSIETKQAQQGRSVEQYVQFELGSVDRARSLATVKQGETTIKSELIGTPDDTYSRYRSIETNQKNAQGKALNVSKVEGVWSKNDKTADGSGQQLFAQATIGIGLPLGSVPVPVGEVSPQQREALLKQIRDNNVYDASFKDIVKKRVNGRLEYTYTANMQTILYVRMMKTFANDLGLKHLDAIDPNQYSSSAPIAVQLTVDALSRRLVEISVAGGGYAQRYVSYGVSVTAPIPQNPISATELQRRLGEL